MKLKLSFQIKIIYELVYVKLSGNFLGLCFNVLTLRLHLFEIKS